MDMLCSNVRYLCVNDIFSIKSNHILDNAHNYDYNMLMKLRFFCIIQSLLSVLFGALIYLLFRGDTYLGSLEAFSYLSRVHFTGDFIFRYYLPDMLWCYGFCASLCALYLPQNSSLWICFLAAGMIGALWETIQMFVPSLGTADLFDCVSYLIGAGIFSLIYIMRGKSK